MRFEIYQGKDSQWYWRLIAGNNRIIAVGGEGYVSKHNAKRAVSTVIRDVCRNDAEGTLRIATR